MAEMRMEREEEGWGRRRCVESRVDVREGGRGVRGIFEFAEGVVMKVGLVVVMVGLKK